MKACVPVSPVYVMAACVLGFVGATTVLAQITVDSDTKGPVTIKQARLMTAPATADAADVKGPVTILAVDKWFGVKKIVDTFNTGGVVNGGKPVTFTLTRPYKIVLIQTYHWNNGRGQPPATGSIGMRRSPDGATWRFTTTSAPGSGVQNVFYNANINMLFPAGTYTIIDDTATWSCNAQSGGLGFVLITAQQLSL